MFLCKRLKGIITKYLLEKLQRELFVYFYGINVPVWISMHSLVIFASGTGTNEAAIIAHFKSNGNAKISLIVSNRAEAGVLEIAKREEIPFLIVDKETFRETLLIEQIRNELLL